jgi:hypothetical protein
VDGMSFLRKENRIWHGCVVPLLAVPELIHRGGSEALIRI